MKKLVSLLLVLALMLSLCGSALAEDKETITVYVQMEGTSGDWNTMAYYTDPETGINAQAGVDVKFTNIMLNDWSTKLNLMFNDKPDAYADVIMRNSRTVSLTSYIEEELIIPLEDYIDKYMPNYKALLEANPYFADLLTDTDGHIYTLGVFSSFNMANANADSILYINKTWLDNLGLEIPTTIEEMEAVLTAFAEQDADGDGDPTNEIPFTGRYGFNMDGFQNWAYCWGLPVNGAYCYIKDGRVVDYVQSDVYRDCLETLHRWYSNGLIDVEAVTQDNATWLAKLRTGKVGCFFGNLARWCVGSANGDHYVDIMLPTAIEGVTPQIRTYLLQPDAGFNLTYMAAERGEEHIAAVCRWIDAQYDFENMVTARWGFEGKGWEYDENGMVVLLGGVCNDGTVPGERAAFYGVDPELYVSKIKMTGDDYELQSLFRKYQDAGYFEETPYQFVFDVIPWTAETKAAFKLTYTELAKFIDEYSCKFVANGITDADWEAYLAACDTMKVDEYVAAMDTDYVAYKDGISQ